MKKNVSPALHSDIEVGEGKFLHLSRINYAQGTARAKWKMRRGSYKMRCVIFKKPASLSSPLDRITLSQKPLS